MVDKNTEDITCMTDQEIAVMLRKEADKQNKKTNTATLVLFIVALLYTILPDLVPGPVDDVAVDSVSGIIIVVLQLIAQRRASQFIDEHKDEYIRAFGSKISNEKLKKIYDSEIERVGATWEARDAQKTEHLANQVNQAKDKIFNKATQTKVDSSQTHMDVF